MRVNVYAEELSNNVELVEKEIDGQKYHGVRFWLYLPVTLPDGKVAKGPFLHRPGDDDSSAVTFWGKRNLKFLLEQAIDLLDKYYSERAEAESEQAEQDRLAGESEAESEAEAHAQAQDQGRLDLEGEA